MGRKSAIPFILVVVACAGPDLAPVASVSTSAVVETTSVMSTTSLAEAANETTTTDAGVMAADFQVPFRIDGADLLPRYSLGNEYLEFSAGVGRVLLFTTGGRATAAEWVEYLTTDPRLVSSEPEAIEIGGLPGTVLEVSLAGPEFPLFTYSDNDPGTPDVQWVVHEGHLNRVLVTDVSNDAVAIIADAPEAEAAEFFSEVDALLEGLEWGS